MLFLQTNKNQHHNFITFYLPSLAKTPVVFFGANFLLFKTPWYCNAESSLSILLLIDGPLILSIRLVAPPSRENAELSTRSMLALPPTFLLARLFGAVCDVTVVLFLPRREKTPTEFLTSFLFIATGLLG